MVVQHNLTAFNSNRMLGITTSAQAKSTEKLSSGYKVNRAADDAAGLAISEKMRRQIRGLTQASANCQDGISICQIADGALNEVHDMLKRCEELAIKASNDTNTEQDREFIQKELDQLAEEIDRVHTTTVFNERNVFSDLGIDPSYMEAQNSSIHNATFNKDGSLSFITDTGITVEVGLVDADGNRVSAPADTNATGTVNSDSVSNSGLAQFAVKAAANAVSKLAAAYPNLFGSASTNNIQVGLDLSNIDGNGRTLATAALSLSSSSDNTIMSYRMKIDTSDYGIAAFDSYTDAKKADLAGVIAHEMTHLMMYDTVTTKMLGSDMFPDWFIEGTAQTSSGDNGHLSYSLNPSSSDAAIRSYMGKLFEKPYGPGYLATAYLGMSASGADMSNVTSANIAKGLDNILIAVSQGKSFDEAIKENTGNKFSSLSNFQQTFKSAGGDSLAFVHDFLNARGTNGAGSILYPLNTPESTAFAPSSLVTSAGSYTINPENTWYSNGYGTNITWPKPGIGGGTGGDDGNAFVIQAGAEAGQFIYINRYNVSAGALFGGQKMDVTGAYREPGNGEQGDVVYGDAASRADTIDIIKEADRRVSVVRSYYGAVQNRLEHTIKNLDNVVENTTAAESLIRDTDMAREMVRYSNLNILAQAGTSMLAQANQSNQTVLSLLS